MSSNPQTGWKWGHTYFLILYGEVKVGRKMGEKEKEKNWYEKKVHSVPSYNLVFCNSPWFNFLWSERINHSHLTQPSLFLKVEGGLKIETVTTSSRLHTTLSSRSVSYVFLIKSTHRPLRLFIYLTHKLWNREKDLLQKEYRMEEKSRGTFSNGTTTKDPKV